MNNKLSFMLKYRQAQLNNMFKPPSIEQILADQEKNRVAGTPAAPSKLIYAVDAAKAMVTKSLDDIGGLVKHAIYMNGDNKVHMPHRITTRPALLKAVITELEKMGYKITENTGHVKGYDISWDLVMPEEPVQETEEERAKFEYFGTC